MSVRGRAVHKDHRPTNLFLMSYLPLTIVYFHIRCQSGSYLGKYKRI